MKIWSPDFEPGEAIPAVFTCDGEDRPPALSWSGVPAAAKSLALAVEDPDAPRGTWVHWIVVGLSPSSSGLASGRGLPAGAREIANDFGRPGYGGPCPPRGTHRYYFRLYALDVEDLPGATRANYSAQCRRHALAAAELMGRYARR